MLPTVRLGLAGRVARAFLHSRVTPLLVVASVALGCLALATLPREEEPQIQVPMVDVTVDAPGATVAEVERQIVAPLERQLWRIPGIEYLYSTSRDDGALLIARFLVGHNTDDALNRVRTRLDEVAGGLPHGARVASVSPRSIDDVPILVLTVWDSVRVDTGDGDLRLVADELATELRKTHGVAAVRVIGGAPRMLTVAPDPRRMNDARVAIDDVLAALARAGVARAAGDIVRDNARATVRVESPLASADHVRALPIAARGGRLLRLSEIASVTDGPAEHASYVIYGDARGVRHPAVVVEVAKLPGVNATRLVRTLDAQLHDLRPHLLGRLAVTVSRDYGETARHKSDDLMFHLLLATLSVITLIALALGRREALVVAIAIPVTLALTLFVYRFLGYTLNRVTLFALIFSIGILVDDAIVVVENIARHVRMRDRSLDHDAAVVAAVDEVGNPTILATVTVVAAILPLAFVGGLMGPYMKPIPIGASLAMVFSLLVAFIVSPWAARIVLRPGAGAHDETQGGRMDRLYRRFMGRLLASARARAAFFAGMIALLLAAGSLLALRAVVVKMLPFDNKSEFEVVLDMPPGTPLERTLAVASAIGDRLSRVPEVEDYAVFAGTGAPVTFNGLVRHYDMRTDARHAEILVRLRAPGERRAQSHAIARRVRPDVEAVARRSGARVKVVEVPPGPPVLSTLVAEVYGPDLAGQRALAHGVWNVMRSAPGVVDTDLLLTENQPQWRLIVDRDRAVLAGVTAADVTRTIATLSAGATAGELRAASDATPVPIHVRLAPADRASIEVLRAVRVGSGAGTPIGEMTATVHETAEPEIHHKNMHRVVYVLGDVAGREESPVYAIGALKPRVARLPTPDGVPLEQLNTHMPHTDERYALKWDGEWQITYEVFRDMGAAFAVVLVLIYVLTVAWFKSFVTPLVIMLPIPLSLVGILPAHALLGAYFTATSMIGFIAGAGITVRNSIILVDFIELRRAQGSPLAQAVVDAGAVRFRPMLLTAAAVAVGGAVILFDPIFQGLAVALIGGEVAATLLSRVAVPVLYYLVRRRDEHPIGTTAAS